MGRQSIWVFKDRRTNPAIVHRFTLTGEPNAVEIHILRDQTVDSVAKDAVEVVPVSAPPGSPCLVHLPKDWRNQVWWGPNDEYIGPRGLFYVEEGEYPNPHAELAAAETSRIPPVKAPEPVVDVSKEAPVVSEQNADVQESPPPVTAKPDLHASTHENAEHLPDGFPGKAKLEAAGVKTFGKVRKRIEAGTLIDIDGIGTETAKAIEEAVK